MFKCQACQNFSKPNEGQKKKVVEYRRKEYENTVRHGKKLVTKKTEGLEIVREISICTACSTN